MGLNHLLWSKRSSTYVDCFITQRAQSGGNPSLRPIGRLTISEPQNQEVKEPHVDQKRLLTYFDMLQKCEICGRAVAVVKRTVS